MPSNTRCIRSSSAFSSSYYLFTMRFINIIIAAAAPWLVLAAPKPKAKKFLFTGVNEAGGEFGTALPGQLNRDYIWPKPEAIDVSWSV